jgi:hypothetical protein
MEPLLRIGYNANAKRFFVTVGTVAYLYSPTTLLYILSARSIVRLGPISDKSKQLDVVAKDEKLRDKLELLALIARWGCYCGAS